MRMQGCKQKGNINHPISPNYSSVLGCAELCKVTNDYLSFLFPQVELKFPAPSKTGNYQYSVILRSDSFMGLDQIKPLKVS